MNKEPKRNRIILPPREIYLALDVNENITDLDKTVFSMIKQFDRLPHHCFLTNEEIAETFKKNPVSISVSINRLIENGYVKLISLATNGRRRVIAIDEETIEELYGEASNARWEWLWSFGKKVEIKASTKLIAQEAEIKARTKLI